jgi:pimeloyl-ACP methyl ester carboxylesterase
MHFVRFGSGGPTLLFVHGFACAHDDWAAQLQALQDRHEVLACDLRAHGATPGRAQECSIEHYGGDVAALLAALELPSAVLVGHSMGCRVVLEAARLDPARVAGLVLIDGSRLGTGDPAKAESGLRSAIEAVGYPVFVEDFFVQMFLRPTQLSREIVSRAMQLPADVGTALLPRMARWDAERMDEALTAVRAPLLVIQTTRMNEQRKRVAMQPGESSPWLDLVRSRVPAARIELLPGLGHFPQIEAPEAVNRLIRSFLVERIKAE